MRTEVTVASDEMVHSQKIEFGFEYRSAAVLLCDEVLPHAIYGLQQRAETVQ
jgi:hypothetical protein